MTWSTADIPDQSGRVFVVTGANSGLGLETTRELARRNATVIMACRTPAKADAAVEEVRRDAPDARLEVRPLDLASLASVRAFATGLLADHPRIDALINNAGIMAFPHSLTADGLESQIGTNHFGHFALTGLLFPSIEATGGRVVTVTSLAALAGRMRWDDLHGERFYERWMAYTQSKLANQLFHYELAARLESGGRKASALLAHPGFASTNLQQASVDHGFSVLGWIFASPIAAAFSQSAAMGAEPQLYAATAPELSNGDFLAPGGLRQWWGHAVRVPPASAKADVNGRRRLWDISVQTTGVTFGGL